MRYLLDTCVISEAIKARPNRRVVDWLRTCVTSDVYISVLTLGEIQKGISKIKDEKRIRKLQPWLDQDIQSRFAGRILSIDSEVARTWGEIQGKSERSGRTLPTIDGLLAATALVHRLCLVTRNVDHFLEVDLKVLNLWKA